MLRAKNTRMLKSTWTDGCALLHNDGLLTSIKISLQQMLILCAPTKKEVDKTKKSGLEGRKRKKQGLPFKGSSCIHLWLQLFN